MGGRGRHHYLHSVSLSKFKKTKIKEERNVVIPTTRSNEQYLGSGGEEDRNSTSHGPLWEEGGIGRPLVCSPCTKVMLVPISGVAPDITRSNGLACEVFQ